MNKIICRLTPVTQPSITVTDEKGNQIENSLCSAKDFSKCLFSHADKYNIKDEIYFSGPHSYTTGLIKVMEKENLTDYNFNDYTIHLI